MPNVPPAATRLPRPRRFASPAMLRRLATVLLVFGVGAAFFGVAYDINGATQARADVKVRVQARPGATLELKGTTAQGNPSQIVVKQGESTEGPPAVSLAVPQAPEGAHLSTRADPLTLSAWNSTVPEQMLNRGGAAVLGLCLGGGSLLLYFLLTSIAEGQPFRRGNAGRIAGIGGLIVIASLARDILPSMGSQLVLHRLDISDGPLIAPSGVSIEPLVLALLLLALAEAFRRGTELARDVEGLI